MNYLLLGENELLDYLTQKINDSETHKAYYISCIDKYNYEKNLINLKIDNVIVEGFEHQKLSNSSKDLRYNENYKYIIDLCVKYNIKHLHIIEDASRIYEGCIKETKDYKYKESDDIYAFNLDSINHLYIRKYIDYINLTTPLVITVSRYNKILSYDTGLLYDFLLCVKDDKEFEYVENNLIRDYITIYDGVNYILKLCNLKERGIYNLPASYEFSKTDLINFCIKDLELVNVKIKSKTLRIMPQKYILDDSKIYELDKKVSNQ